MSYAFDFSDLHTYAEVLARGVMITLGLTAAATMLGGALGVAGAVLATAGPRWSRALVGAYVELIRNTPFLVQLFFVFFGLPSLGLHIDASQPESLRRANCRLPSRSADAHRRVAVFGNDFLEQIGQ